MAWYEKLNPFIKQEKAYGVDDSRMWTNYSVPYGANQTVQGYLDTYGNVGWVFACVQRISSAVAATDWKLYNTKQNEITELQEHPVLDLLNFVNPYHTGMELMEQTQTFIDLVGESFWLVIRDRANRPAELWAINPNKIKVVPASDEYIKGYVYENGDSKIPLEKDDIIHIKLPNPSNPYRGLPPVASIMSDVDAEKFSSSYNKAFFQNSAEPSGIIQFEGTLSDSQYERLRYQWNQQHGGVQNAHKIAILEGGASWHAAGITQKDMQFKELRLMNRDVILGAFGMPLSILGISETVNRANAEAGEYTFARWVVRPRLNRIQAKLNEAFVPLFGDNLKLMYSDPVPQNVERDLQVANTGFTSGYITRNEAREKIGLPPVDEGDNFYTPMNMAAESMFRNAGRTQPKLLKSSSVLENTQSIKSTRWKQFIDLQEELQDKATETIHTYLFEQELKVFEIIDQNNLDQPEFEIALGNLEVSEVQRAKDMIRPILEEATLKGAEDTRDNIVDRVEQQTRSYNQKQDLTTAFTYVVSLDTPRIAASIVVREAVFSELTNKSTFDKVKSVVLKGITEGVSVNTIKEGILKTGVFSNQRATAIARTETLGAINQGNLISAQESEIVEVKEWVTTLDGAARDSHEDMDGVRIRVNEEFRVGVDSMLAPGGGSDPEENINCRCTIIEIIDTSLLPQGGVRPSRSVDTTENNESIVKIDSKTEYTYPVLEARCPQCKKLLGKKLNGVVTLHCLRCKKQVKFDTQKNKVEILKE